MRIFSRAERAKGWRQRAEEIRTAADSIRDKTAKRQLMDTASGYERMAEHAEARDTENCASFTTKRSCPTQ
jgi:hypothetical protein